MESEKNSISIIIPSYNRAQLLKETLKSIESQSSDNWECIIVDDFSKDDTKDVVLEYSKRNVHFAYYLNEHKKGAQGARNTGLDHAKNDWVIFFDSDNKMHPDFIEVMSSLITNDNGIDVLACCSDVIDIEKGNTGKVMNPRCKGNIHDNLFTNKSYVDYNQAIIRKSRLFEIGGLDEDCPSMQEWDTHIRLSNVAKYDMIEQSLVDYYVGGNDAISSNTKREAIGRLYILRKHIDEWRTHSHAMSVFSYRIYRTIKKNEDHVFVSEKTKELKNLVSYLPIRIAYCKVINLFIKIKNKL